MEGKHSNEHEFINLELKIFCLCLRELVCELLVHFTIHPTKIHWEIWIAGFFFRVLKSCLIGGNHWTLERSEILKDGLDIFAHWLNRSVSKYSKTLGLFQMKAGGKLFSYNRIRFILTTNPDISSNRIMGVLSWIVISL